MLCLMIVISKINGLKILLILYIIFFIFIGLVNDLYWLCYSVLYKLINKIGWSWVIVYVVYIYLCGNFFLYGV